MNARTDLPLGLVHDLPIADYHASPGISNSGLGDFARSPFHFHALHLNPLRPPAKETPSQLAGNLFHCAIFESDDFAARYPVGPNVKTKNSRDWHAFEESLQPGQVAIKAEQAEIAQAQALSVRSNPELARLLRNGRHEVSAYWIDPATGELCRCRPDWTHTVNPDGVILLDGKTCGDASPSEFARQIGRMGYHRQAAFYTDGYEAATGKTVLAFIFGAVEDKWPFASSAVMLDDESLERGRAENAELLERYAACRRANDWPGYGAGVELVTLPRWLTAKPLTTTEESPA